MGAVIVSILLMLIVLLCRNLVEIPAKCVSLLHIEDLGRIILSGWAIWHGGMYTNAMLFDIWWGSKWGDLILIFDWWKQSTTVYILHLKVWQLLLFLCYMLYFMDSCVFYFRWIPESLAYWTWNKRWKWWPRVSAYVFQTRSRAFVRQNQKKNCWG